MEDEAFDHIAECLLNSPEINQLGEGIAQLLIDQAAATIAMRRSSQFLIIIRAIFFFLPYFDKKSIFCQNCAFLRSKFQHS